MRQPDTHRRQPRQRASDLEKGRAESSSDFRFEMHEWIDEQRIPLLEKWLPMDPERSELQYWQRPKWLCADLLLPHIGDQLPTVNGKRLQQIRKGLAEHEARQVELKKYGGGGRVGLPSCAWLARIAELVLHDPSALTPEIRDDLLGPEGWDREIENYFFSKNSIGSELTFRYMLMKLIFPDHQESFEPPAPVIEKERENLARDIGRYGDPLKGGQGDKILQQILRLRIAAPHTSLRDIVPDLWIEANAKNIISHQATFLHDGIDSEGNRQSFENAIVNALRASAAVALLQSPHVSVTRDHRLSFQPLQQTEDATPNLPPRQTI